MRACRNDWLACLGMDEQHKATADNRKRVGAEGEERKRADTFFPFCSFPQSLWGSWPLRRRPPLLSLASVSFLKVLKVAPSKNFLTNSLRYYKIFFLYHPEHGITFQIALVGRLVLRATSRGKDRELPGLLWRTLKLMERGGGLSGEGCCSFVTCGAT